MNLYAWNPSFSCKQKSVIHLERPVFLHMDLSIARRCNDVLVPFGQRPDGSGWLAEKNNTCDVAGSALPPAFQDGDYSDNKFGSIDHSK